MSAAAPSPIYIKPLPPDQVEDLFGRTELVDQVSSYIARLPQGGVFAIDAPWGEGKTWFGHRLEAKLAESHKTVLLDAFARDYMEDPFLMLAAELLEALSDTEQQALKDAVVKVGKAVLPIAAKVLTSVASRALLGSADGLSTIAEAADDTASSVSAAFEATVRQHLKDYEAEKSTTENLKRLLQEAARRQPGGKIVVIIDELDRCRPSYAVRVLERIKHFFDVEGICFVLLLNREQMVEAIKGVYGAGVNAEGYLGKFIQFSISLPKRLGERGTNAHYVYLRALLQKYGYPLSDDNEHFSTSMTWLAQFLSMSLRDLERAVTLFSLTSPHWEPGLAAWPIALRIKKPTLFQQIRRNEQDAHLKAHDLMTDYVRRSNENYTFRLWDLLHTKAIYPDDKERLSSLDPQAFDWLSKDWTLRHADAHQLFGAVDLRIS